MSFADDGALVPALDDLRRRRWTKAFVLAWIAIGLPSLAQSARAEPEVVDLPTRPGVTQRIAYWAQENSHAAIILFADAGEGYLDIKRVGALLARIKGKIIHRDLPHVSPFAAPVMLEMGKVGVRGGADEAVLEDAASLIAEAMS